MRIWDLSISQVRTRCLGASHHVYGRKAGYVFDPIDWTYTECKNIHSARMLKRLGSQTSLHGTIRSWAIR